MNTGYWVVYWDNGAEACGTFQERYETEEAAAQAAANWYVEFCADNGLDPDDDSHGASAGPLYVEVLVGTAGRQQ